MRRLPILVYAFDGHFDHLLLLRVRDSRVFACAGGQLRLRLIQFPSPDVRVGRKRSGRCEKRKNHSGYCNSSFHGGDWDRNIVRRQREIPRVFLRFFVKCLAPEKGPLFWSWLSTLRQAEPNAVIGKAIDAQGNSSLDVIMKTSTLLLILTLGLATATVGRADDDQTLHDLDTQWSKAASAKDLDKTVSFYSDDANVLPANAPIVTTKEAIRKIWKEMFDTPGFSLTWKATKVEVAKSGEIGFVTGTYESTMNDADGKPVKHQGKYVEVWEKKGGTWKCGVDIWNSDLPEKK